MCGAWRPRRAAGRETRLISGVSRTSERSRTDLGPISDGSQPCLDSPRPYLGCTSAVPRPYHGCTSAVPRPGAVPRPRGGRLILRPRGERTAANATTPPPLHIFTATRCEQELGTRLIMHHVPPPLNELNVWTGARAWLSLAAVAPTAAASRRRSPTARRSHPFFTVGAARLSEKAALPTPLFSRHAAPSRCRYSVPWLHLHAIYPRARRRWPWKWTPLGFVSPERVIDRLQRQSLAFRPPGER